MDGSYHRDGGYHRFGDVPDFEEELPEPQSLAVTPAQMEGARIVERQRDQEKSMATHMRFWAAILGGLDTEFLERFDEFGYRGLSAND